MFARASFPHGERAGEELHESRRKGLPSGTAALSERSSPNHPVVGEGSALPGFLKRRSGHRGQQQQPQYYGSDSLPGMDSRPSALRTAFHSNGDRGRWSNDAGGSTDTQQQQRRGDSGYDSRKRDLLTKTTTAPSWEFREPEQPRGSSPMSRPPHRQGGLNVLPSRGDGGGNGGNVKYEVQPFESREPKAGENTGNRSAAPGYREVTGGGGNTTTYSKCGSGGETGREVAEARTSTRLAGGTVSSGGNIAERAPIENSAGRRSSGRVAVGGSGNCINNQAEDIMSFSKTPRRLSSSSTRAASCPSGSPYLEPGFHRAGGRVNRRSENAHNHDPTYNCRRSPGAGVGSGRCREGNHHHHQQNEGGRGISGVSARTRASHPSTAPAGSTTVELDRRLPFIDGLDNNVSAEACMGGGAGGGRNSVRGEEACFASSLSSSALITQDSEHPGSVGRVGVKASTASERKLSGQGLLPGNEPTLVKITSNNDAETNDNTDRGEDAPEECAGAIESAQSRGGRIDRNGHNNARGRASSESDSTAEMEIAQPSRRMGSNNNGGGGLRSNHEVAPRNSSSSNSVNFVTGIGNNSNNNNNSSGSSSNNNSGRTISKNSSKRERLVGLQNLGNTCFMNASLQCLLHTDALVELFRNGIGQHEQRLSGHNSKSPTRGALAEAFRELVALVEVSPAHSVISPSQVKRLIGKYAPHLAGYGQQDCQEFLRFFLDGLAEDLNRPSTVGQSNHTHHRGGHDQQKLSAPPPPPPVVPSLTDEEISRLTAEQQADRAWALHLAKNDSEITGMFCGQLQSRISCLSCGNVSFCFDPFFDLSVPLPSSSSSRGALAGERGGDEGGGHTGRNARSSTESPGFTTTLEDCLRAFSTIETLDGDNRPVCSRCRRRRKAQKRLAVHRFPPILVIHLKRFQYNSTSRTKLSTTVDFPIGSGLNLAPYATPDARPSSSGSSGGVGHNGDRYRLDGSSTSSSTSAKTSNGKSSMFRGGGRSSGGSNCNIFKDSTSGNRPSSPVYYELYAVCNHMGGLQGGHYTAHCRTRSTFSDGDCDGGDGGSCGVSAGEWHTFDDTRVGPVNTSRVGGASAYVLFYRLLKRKGD